MKRTLTIDGKSQQIEILTPTPECRFRMDDQAERTALVEMPEPGVYSVILDGRSYEVRIEGNALVVDHYRFDIEVTDPREWSPKSRGRTGDGVQTIAAPMPGKIVRVLVAAGDEVKTGQGLLVVEAMKMQNEMRAPRGGRVLTIAALEGATVVAGEVLATIE